MFNSKHNYWCSLLFDIKFMKSRYDLKTKDILTITSFFKQKQMSFTRYIKPLDKIFMINTMFKWTLPGSCVFISGTWDSWNKRIPLKKSGNEFTVILPLIQGFFRYRFAIDDSHRYNPELGSKIDFCKTLTNFKIIKRLDKEIISSDSLLGGETETYFYLQNPSDYDVNGRVGYLQTVPIQLLISIFSKSGFKKKKFISEKISPGMCYSKMISFNHLIFYKSFLTKFKFLKLIFFTRFRFRSKLCTFFYVEINDKTLKNNSHPIKNLFKT